MLLQFLERRLEPPLELGRRVRPAHPDVFAGQRPQVEVEPRAAIEPFIEKAKHPLGRRQPQAQIELEIELLEVAALETLEDHLVPAEARQGEGGLPRAARPTRRPAPLAVVERDVVENVEI